MSLYYAEINRRSNGPVFANATAIKSCMVVAVDKTGAKLVYQPPLASRLVIGIKNLNFRHISREPGLI